MKIIKSKNLPWMGVSHNPEIKKKTFIGNGLIPKLTTLGKAVFKPGQIVSEHKHETMFEVFYILKGKAMFVVEGKKHILEKQECLVLEPGELHSQSNPYHESVEWVYFGVATDR